MAELTDEQKEVLSEAVDAFDGPEALADALQNNHNEHFSEIWQRGHSTATGQKKGDITDLQDEVESLKATVKSKDEEIASLQEEKPDLQSLRKGWEEDELTPVKAERDEWKDKFIGGEKERAERKVIDHLTEKLDGNRWLAERVVKQDANGRIEIDDDGNAEFIRPDGKTPYTPGENHSAPELMAENFYKEIPEDHRPDNAQGGKRENDVRPKDDGEEIEGVTRQDLADDPAKMAEFIGQFDSREEGIEAMQSLPDE